MEQYRSFISAFLGTLLGCVLSLNWTDNHLFIPLIAGSFGVFVMWMDRVLFNMSYIEIYQLIKNMSHITFLQMEKILSIIGTTICVIGATILGVKFGSFSNSPWYLGIGFIIILYTLVSTGFSCLLGSHTVTFFGTYASKKLYLKREELYVFRKQLSQRRYNYTNNKVLYWKETILDLFVYRIISNLIIVIPIIFLILSLFVTCLLVILWNTCIRFLEESKKHSSIMTFVTICVFCVIFSYLIIPNYLPDTSTLVSYSSAIMFSFLAGITNKMILESSLLENIRSRRIEEFNFLGMKVE